MTKEIPEPINVSPALKAFLIDKKNDLKDKYKKFYSVPSTLLYYLIESNSFVTDYSEYCKKKGFKNDLISDEEPKDEINKILKFIGKDTLKLLVKKQS